MRLLKEAVCTYDYDYLHFCVGTEFPLKSQDYIHEFFDKNKGKEFIGFCKKTEIYKDRVMYYYPFNETGRPSTWLQAQLNQIRKKAIKPQRMLHVNLVKNSGWILMKGNADWSITGNCAKYIVSQEKKIKKYYRHSFCADEVFIHTLIYNSPFYDAVYDKENEYHSNMRIVQWEAPGNLYHMKDLDMLLKSDYLFARKFSGDEGNEMQQIIRRSRKETIII